jgi:hypothetical protein
MRKPTILSGASQHAYFRRLLKAYPSLPAAERDRVLERLRGEIAQLRLRRAADCQPALAPPPTVPTTPRRPNTEKPLRSRQAAGLPSAEPASAVATAAFDPFSPNIVVVVRQAGRAAALAALATIDSAKDLRLLAHEQRLSLNGQLSSLAELRAAIVAAAERRIANRLAAAS